MRNEYPTSRVPPAVGSVLMYLVGILVIGSAVLKFAQPPTVVVQFRELGYEGTKLILIGILEICCSLLFMIPYTRSIGLLLLSAYLGGAIATHVGHGQPAAVGPAVLLTLAWLGVSLRHPNIFWSFRIQS
jgi:DoxX-like family